MKVGAQLFTVRDFTKTLPDFADTLAKVAEIGYTSVQVSGTCAYEADWLNTELKKNGLTCKITHSPFDKMKADPQGVVAFHRGFDCDCLGLGSYPDIATEAGVQKFLSEVPAVAHAIKEAGALFSYHNHSSEFHHINGKPILQILAESVPAEEMAFTLDCYWVQNAGADPAQWLLDLAGRVPYIHVKDMEMNGGNSDRIMAPIGQGNMNFPKIMQAAADAGTKVVYVEQDDCNGADPFACLKTSFEYLRALGLDA